MRGGGVWGGAVMVFVTWLWGVISSRKNRNKSVANSTENWEERHPNRVNVSDKSDNLFKSV